MRHERIRLSRFHADLNEVFRAGAVVREKRVVFWNGIYYEKGRLGAKEKIG